VIIAVILFAPAGLGFANDYKAAKTAEAFHSSVRHGCVVWRDWHAHTVDVTELLPGDVVDLELGQVVPAGLRLLTAAGLECDESVLTGEPVPARAVHRQDGHADRGQLLGLLCKQAVVENDRAVGSNPLDVALWGSPAAAGQQSALTRYRRLGILPFDHERRAVSVLTEDDRGNRMIITKGAPEGVLGRCTAVPAAARAPLEAELAASNRVIAVAARPAADLPRHPGLPRPA
jgi:magnesium-transporting ATPase (P-type)